MIIDKTDKLYTYLTKLGVDNIDEAYTYLASIGRYTRDDVQTYFSERFKPSITQELDERELEQILDYYGDLKKVARLNSSDLSRLLAEYKRTNDTSIRERIINSQLKDVLLMCLNYKTVHKDVDLQDLVQVANIGLMTAIEKYEPKYKIALKDYIIYYLNELISEEFEEKKNG